MERDSKTNETNQSEPQEEAEVRTFSQADVNRMLAGHKRTLQKEKDELSTALTLLEDKLEKLQSQPQKTEDGESLDQLKRKVEMLTAQNKELSSTLETAQSFAKQSESKMQTYIMRDKISTALSKAGVDSKLAPYAIRDLLEVSEYEAGDKGDARVITRVGGMLYEDTDGAALEDAAKKFLESNPHFVSGPKGGTGHPQPSGNKTPVDPDTASAEELFDASF